MSFDRDLMLKDVLSFLIADMRKRNNLYEYDVLELFPDYALSKPSKPVLFKPLLLLLNLYSIIRKIDIYVLQEIDIPPTTVAEVQAIVASVDSPSEKVDWRRTILHRFKGGNGIVIKKKVIEIDKNQLLTISMIAVEIITHSEILTKHFQPEVRASSHIAYIVSEITRLTERFKSKISILGSDIFNSERITNFKKTVSDLLLSELSISSSDMSNYLQLVHINIESYNTLSSITDMLLRLRSQYLNCAINLTNSSGIEISTNVSTPNLYEIWAFMSLLNTMIALDCPAIQNCFISGSTIGPLFDIKENHLVYYDNRQHSFLKNKHNFVIQPAVISGAFVEWFINNKNDYTNSYIIDTKYRSWNSSDVLKVMGYLVNFGVKNGVVVFRDKLNHKSIQGEKLFDGFYHCKSGHPHNTNLYIMSLIPTKSESNNNKERLEILARLFS